MTRRVAVCVSQLGVIKLTTPFHFPVSVCVHSPAVELVIFGPRFPPEPILQGENRDTAIVYVCPLTARLIEQMELQNNPSVTDSALFGLLLLLSIYLL